MKRPPSPPLKTREDEIEAVVCLAKKVGGITRLKKLVDALASTPEKRDVHGETSHIESQTEM